MTEELTQIAEVINSLGEKGLTAFITWIIVDLGKAILGWTCGIILAAVVFGRIRDAVVGGIREAVSNDSTRE